MKIILGEINLEQNIYICRLFKYNFSFEPYLLYLSEEKRKLLTKFRISAHKLEIEHGRYHKLPIANRICGPCKTEVGDEIHFSDTWWFSVKVNIYLFKILFLSSFKL
jgi:hypothetical protein